MVEAGHVAKFVGQNREEVDPCRGIACRRLTDCVEFDAIAWRLVDIPTVAGRVVERRSSEAIAVAALSII